MTLVFFFLYLLLVSGFTATDHPENTAFPPDVLQYKSSVWTHLAPITCPSSVCLSGDALLGFWGIKVNAWFEEEGCASFIVLFYRPLPDSWRDFKTTTCPHFTPAASPCPALCPPPRSKAGQGFNCKFKPVFVSAMGKNRHLQETPTSIWPRADRLLLLLSSSSILLPLHHSVTPPPPVCLHWQAAVCVRAP